MTSMGSRAVSHVPLLYTRASTRASWPHAAIGPGIGQCCYEVGPDVVKEFAAQFPRAKSWFEGPFDALASGEDPNPLPWLAMMPPGPRAPSAALPFGSQSRKRCFAHRRRPFTQEHFYLGPLHFLPHPFVFQLPPRAPHRPPLLRHRHPLG